MDVSIIFVSYNTKDLTRNAIKSVYEKTIGLEYEIFVVDNNSQDGSAQMIETEFPKVKLIKNNENKGFGAANNIAVKQAGGKYIFCLNTDTILVNNAIKIMFDFMEGSANTAVCGGILVDTEGKTLHSSDKFPTVFNIIKDLFNMYILRKSQKYNYKFKKGHKSRITDYIVGADIFFRKSVLDKVGLFDEKIFLYYEETELCKRIKNSGYEVKLLSEPKIIHLEGKSNKDNLLVKKRLKTSELYYFKKHNQSRLFIYVILNKIFYRIKILLFKNPADKEILEIFQR